MKYFKYIIIMLMIHSVSIHQASAQEAIYFQNFSGANGTMSGPGWSVKQSNGCGFSYDFGIDNNVFLVRRARGFNCGCNGFSFGDNKNIAEFGPFDISNHCDIEVSLQSSVEGDLECGDGGASVPYYCNPASNLAEGHEMMWIQVIVDGTPQTMKYYCGNTLIVDNPMAGLNGNSMIIRITAGTQAQNESYKVDDISIQGTPTATVATTISVTPSTTICSGQSVTLTASGPIPYLWNNGSSTPSITVDPLSSTNYTVMTGTGCAQGIASQRISVSAAPQANAGNNTTICRGESITLLASGGATYKWSSGHMNAAASVAPTSTTTYTVTVTTPDGCTDTDDVIITVNEIPTIRAGNDRTICDGDNLTLAASGATTYVWSNGETNSSISISPTTNTTYTVTGTRNGCTASDAISIGVHPKLIIDLGEDYGICPGTETRLSVQEGLTYLWSNNATTAEINIAPSVTENYSITVTDGICTATDEIEISPNADLDPVIIGSALLCQNTKGTLAIQGDYDSYAWSTGALTQSIEVVDADTYSVTVSTDDGCSGMASIDISISEAPVVSFKNNLIFCNTSNPNRSEPTSVDLDTIFDQVNVDGFWTTSSPGLDLSNLPVINLEGANPGRYEMTYNSTNALSPCSEIIETVMLEIEDCQCPDIQLQAIAPLCNKSDQLDLKSIQSPYFDGSWQIAEAPTATLPEIFDNTFNATNLDAGTYKLEFRLIDGIAPLGCDASKSIDLVVLPHVASSIEMIQAPCNGAAGRFQIHLSGGADAYDVSLKYGSNEVIDFNNIEDGHIFDMNLDAPTTFSFSDISSNISTCGFQSDSPSYTFEPSTLEAELAQTKSYGTYGVSCNDSADGAAMVNIRSGTAPYDYIWSDGSKEAEVDHLSSGTYAVSVKDAAGCMFTASIEIEAPPAELIHIDNQDPICGQGTGRLTLYPTIANHNTDWEIYIDGIIQSQTQIPASFNDIKPGSHTLEAISDEGCIETYTFDIADNSDFEIGLADRTVSLGQSTVLYATIPFPYESITWSPDIYLSESTTNFVFVQQPLNSTTYTVTVQGIDGCIYEDLVRVHVDKIRSLAVPTGFSVNGDGINDSFIIHARSEVILINNISVFDRWGEEVFFAQDITPNTPLDWDWTWQNQPLPAGQYIWKANVTFLDNQQIILTDQFNIIR